MRDVLSVNGSEPETPIASEEALVLAAKNGDGQAFELLFKDLRQKVLAVAMRYTPTRHDAEDVLQVSFQKAFVHLHTFKGQSSFCTWLTRIAINESLMLRRRSRGQLEISIDEESLDGERFSSSVNISDSYPDPEAAYLRREAARHLHIAINRLRPNQRRVIVLRELKECSTKETARRLGVSVNATKANLFRGRTKLRQVLKRRAKRLP